MQRRVRHLNHSDNAVGQGSNAMDARITREIEASRTLFTPEDLDALIDDLGESRIVLLGEATHGTADFHHWRAEITMRLIQEKGFFLIGVEGDWSSCYRTNLYLAGASDEGLSAADVLSASFARWPTWMWANYEMAALMDRLRAHNHNGPAGGRNVRFYGLDLYGLWESLEEITRYLLRVDPRAAQAARETYKCFEPYRGLEEYYSTRQLVPDSCRNEVITLLAQAKHRAKQYPENDDAPLNERRNAQVAAGAEDYYGKFLTGGVTSWNARERHLAESVKSILSYYDVKYGIRSQIIIWAHNTHVGDARATEMADYGMVNMGQLLREDFPGATRIVGFDSYWGRAIAAGRWDGLMEEFRLPAAQKGSWEHLLHEATEEDKVITLNEVFRARKDQRAVGVVYNPGLERGNYVPSVLADRYDYLIFIHASDALHPLPVGPAPGSVPQTLAAGV
jgi:erythromycin esterase